MTRGGYRPGSGQPPIAGQPKWPHTIGATEAQWAEICAAVPADEPVGPWVIDAALMRARGGEVSGERYTYCPFCDGRILVGQPVAAVEHEDPFRALAHIACKTRAAVKALHCSGCFDVVNSAPKQNPCGCGCHR